MAIGAVLASDDLCALADALGADEADETEDDDERFDAVATRKAQTLLQVLELDAARDERVARRVLAACFRVPRRPRARALRETHESASRRASPPKMPPRSARANARRGRAALCDVTFGGRTTRGGPRVPWGTTKGIQTTENSA